MRADGIALRLLAAIAILGASANAQPNESEEAPEGLRDDTLPDDEDITDPRGEVPEENQPARAWSTLLVLAIALVAVTLIVLAARRARGRP